MQKRKIHNLLWIIKWKWLVTLVSKSRQGPGSYSSCPPLWQQGRRWWKHQAGTASKLGPPGTTMDKEQEWNPKGFKSLRYGDCLWFTTRGRKCFVPWQCQLNCTHDKFLIFCITIASSMELLFDINAQQWFGILYAHNKSLTLFCMQTFHKFTSPLI